MAASRGSNKLAVIRQARAAAREAVRETTVGSVGATLVLDGGSPARPANPSIIIIDCGGVS
jgi:hypothetical protein